MSSAQDVRRRIQLPIVEEKLARVEKQLELTIEQLFVAEEKLRKVRGLYDKHYPRPSKMGAFSVCPTCHTVWDSQVGGCDGLFDLREALGENDA